MVVASSLGYCLLHVHFKIANRFPLFTQDATGMRSVNKQHFDILVNIVSGVPREGWGVQTPSPPKFRSFDKVELDCKVSRKCLVFLFQHRN